MQNLSRFSTICGLVLLLAGLTAPGRASATPAEGEALKQACAGQIQAVTGGAPDSGPEMDKVISLTLEATRDDLLEGREEAAQHAGSEPAMSALVSCLVEARLAQLDRGAQAGGGGAPAGSAAGGGAGGPDSFASGGSAPAGGGQAAAAAPTCDLSLGDASTGTLSTESASLTNGCPVAVGYAYCVKSENGGGAFSCEGQKFGSGWMKAGGSDAISVALASTPFEVHWGYCLGKPGDDHPFASSPHWDGQRVTVVCH
jgi:hypothetical protein